jgi:hypothetical protein
MSSVVGVGPLAGDAVDAERLDLAADVDHRRRTSSRRGRPDVAEQDLAAALHHEARHRAGVAEHDHGAALLVDPVRAPTRPRTSTSPPRIAAAVSEPALPSTTTTPLIMFSHADQPTRPRTCTSGPSIRPRPK